MYNRYEWLFVRLVSYKQIVKRLEQCYLLHKDKTLHNDIVVCKTEIAKIEIEIDIEILFCGEIISV